MSSSKDIFENLQKAVDFMDRHPVPIAIAMTSSFKQRLTSHPNISLIKDHYNTGLKCYIWNDLPEPYRVYFNQKTLDEDIDLYNY